MNKKLKTYKTFEESIFKNGVGDDVDYEAEIDKMLENLIKRKQHISMLKDTVEYICEDIEKALPDLEELMAALQYYDDDIFKSVDEIKEYMIDGFPHNMKDIMENIVEDFKLIEKHLNSKK